MEVTLQGRTFSLRTDDEALLAAVASHVNKRMDEVMASGTVQPQQIALLALLAVGEELFRERRKTAALRAAIRQRSDAILDAVKEGRTNDCHGG